MRYNLRALYYALLSMSYVRYYALRSTRYAGATRYIKTTARMQQLLYHKLSVKLGFLDLRLDIKITNFSLYEVWFLFDQYYNYGSNNLHDAFVGSSLLKKYLLRTYRYVIH